jgi:hypothetical protein
MNPAASSRARIGLMKELRALTPEEFERAREKLLNPPPGSRMAAAKEYGVDLTLLISQLRLSPLERLRRVEAALASIERIRAMMVQQR